MAKNKESFQFPWVQVVCHIPLENSQWRLKLCFGAHLNWRSAHKVMGLQSHRNPNFGEFWNSHLGVPRQWHLDVSPVAKHKEYYKGEGGRWWLSPILARGESCEFVFARGLSMHQRWSSYALTNLLFGLCKSV
jgi:hypothetical protein